MHTNLDPSYSHWLMKVHLTCIQNLFRRYDSEAMLKTVEQIWLKNKIGQNGPDKNQNRFLLTPKLLKGIDSIY